MALKCTRPVFFSKNRAYNIFFLYLLRRCQERRMMSRRKRDQTDTIENDIEGTVHCETTMVSGSYQQFRDLIGSKTTKRECRNREFWISLSSSNPKMPQESVLVQETHLRKKIHSTTFCVWVCKAFIQVLDLDSPFIYFSVWMLERWSRKKKLHENVQISPTCCVLTY